ncbi:MULTISPECIES: MmoB/DmpM family protein [Acinetobacter calcoaceticus/baumannii complex]|uniref:MmoB/DmpM family protein n=1 Tax=Acinetobacter calcoaceticus/baumannii complex TaxID=909768 RepID=UPI00044CE07A|nr:MULTISPECIES: MmoB/DmpM family protein [Acinetobacter calcoaceticus/baumannii complex]EXB99488.1 phenol hydroxylase P2 protein [Acinetobacter baumannii 400834]EXE30048.1 phenol hydroxylase P2 protein [Acinetobacter baumannii 1525283]EXE92540.1 phenol hydroxylase P2 protein [Acinetobacter baumannii 232184]EXG98068.1 phenol hydroxylase P2 protein [Acinetobacter baumannii 1064293_45]EXI13066.1 phenol hydroxylase P2 protein [Acinetobacter sp. 694762]
MSKVYLALQDNDTSRYIIEAIEEDTPEASIQYLPAMIRIESETDLVIKAETVSEKLGQDWDIQSLQLNMITLGGNVEEDDDTFRLHWN